MMTEEYKRILTKKLIDGSISRSEYRQLELAALEDPFLFDALEGYASLTGQEVHNRVLKIEDHVESYLQQKKIKRRNYNLIAASIAGIVLTGIIVMNLNKNMVLHSEENNQTTHIILPDALYDEEDNISVELPNPVVEAQKTNPVRSQSMSAKQNTHQVEKTGFTLMDTFSYLKELVATNVNIINYDTSEAANTSYTELMPAIKSEDVKTEFKIPEILFSNDKSEFKPLNSARKISGRIVDHVGEPLIGASVSAGNNGTITDIDGLFELGISPTDKMITVKYLGFDNKTIELKKDVHQYDLTMDESKALLDEVVVVGYSTQRDKKSYSTSTTFIAKTSQKDSPEAWKKFEYQVVKAIKKELKKIKYPDNYAASVRIEINQENKVIAIKFESSSDPDIDPVIYKIMEKFKNKIPPTAKINYYLNLEVRGK